MRVKLRTIMAGDYGVCHPGNCIEVPDEVGDELIRSRQAEAAPVAAKPESAEEEDEDDGDSDGAETASNPPNVETAVAGRKPRPRRAG